MRKQPNYDKRVKQTRILLIDYLVLKRISLVAGVSMAEMLHSILNNLAEPKPKPKPEPEPEPTEIPVSFQMKPGLVSFQVTPEPVISVMTPEPVISVMKPAISKSAIATNGHTTVAFRIKPKGARYE